MMAKAAGILLVLIVVGVAVTHGHTSGPTCPSGTMTTHTKTSAHPAGTTSGSGR